VLRPMFITGDQYGQHLKGMIGWESERIRTTITDTLDGKLNSPYWMVEVSLPELFPANKRKLGEILLDATKPISSQLDLSTFVLARFPEHLYMLIKDPNQNIILKQYETDIKTHTKIFGVVDEPDKILNISDYCWNFFEKVAAKIKSWRFLGSILTRHKPDIKQT